MHRLRMVLPKPARRAVAVELRTMPRRGELIRIGRQVLAVRSVIHTPTSRYEAEIRLRQP